MTEEVDIEKYPVTGDTSTSTVHNHGSAAWPMALVAASALLGSGIAVGGGFFSEKETQQTVTEKVMEPQEYEVIFTDEDGSEIKVNE